ncbi:MAG: right-handed parallel beta-helix repeat-containing protein [Propionicimonas sp.]|nr:right-handed parallel beta-helix repeat-containing protein [Propionicimonas sp.]
MSIGHTVEFTRPKRLVATAVAAAVALTTPVLGAPTAHAGAATCQDLVDAATGATAVLTSDCEVSSTLVLPDGTTLDGAGHTITAVGSSWAGAIVANDGAGSIAVEDVTITRADRAAPWSASSTAAGLRVVNGGLVATDVTITGILGTNLGNGGYGILVDNSLLGSDAEVTVTGATISDYNKGGIYVFGTGTRATITDSTISSGNPATPPNGILVGSGATSRIAGNEIVGAQSTQAGQYRTGTGILLYGAGDATIISNTISATDSAVAIDYNSAGVTASGRYTGITPVSDVLVAGNLLTGPTTPDEANARGAIWVHSGKTGTARHFANTIAGYADDEELVDDTTDQLLTPLYTTPSVTAAVTTAAGTIPAKVEVAIAGNTSDPRLPFTYTVELLRSGKAVASEPGLAASTSRVTLVAADPGSYTARVTLVTGLASLSADAAAVTATGRITAATPTISGTAKVGRTLTAKAGSWSPSGVAFGYRWLRNGKAIAGATRSTYTLVAADRGQKITVTVTGTRAGFPTVSKTSKATAKVATGSLTTATPKVTGTATVGRKLTAKPGSWGPGSVKLTYRWYRSGHAIPGATKSTYVLKRADRGNRIEVRVTGSKSGFTTVTKKSKATRLVGR